jgi:eukaryotic-like serine/threonine-protein kinase
MPCLEEAMEADRWDRIETVFEQALACEGEELEALLAGACGGDGELRREVESLLAAHRAAGGFIEEPALADWLPSLGPEAAWEGRRIGAYTVVREIGRGGMSRVFLAARSDAEYESRVAIKVMAQGPWTEDLVAHFRRERQILANLHHPNIARLLDGGTLPEGLPYVVMEYVEGVPIDAYCDRERLSIDERLRLFGEVCSAVRHAHANLVVHRDLKPANILVTEGGVPKLLDFGIAKLLEPEGESDLTRTRLQALTPQYASPEQVRGEPVTTATDVYSLGVLLYELLTGRLPYAVRGAPFPEVARRVAEEEPRRPSTVLEPAGAVGESGPEAVAQKRGTSPRQLRRRLAGDLDNIVLTGLRKDPARRYASVERLAEDLSRHLAKLPVSARADTVAYRAGKFWRRHRLAVSLGASALLAIVGLSAVVGLEGRRAARERDKAEQALELLAGLFRQADPMERTVAERASELTVRELLDVGARRLSRELEGEPELRARLLNAIGEAYQSLGLPQEGRRLHAEALAIAERAVGRESPLAAASLHGLGTAHLDAAEYAPAEDRLRRAFALRRDLLGAAHAETVETAAALAGALKRLERNGEADALLRESLEAARREHGARSSEAVTVLQALASLRWQAGAHAEAEALRREVLAIRRHLHGEGHPQVAAAMSELAHVLSESGQSEEQIELYRRAREIWLPLLAEDDPRMLANLNDLATTLTREGRYAEAAAMLHRLVARRRALQGERHPAYVTAVNNLAVLEADRGNWAAAARLWEEVLGVARETFGETSWYVAGSLTNLTFVVREMGDLERAEALAEESLAMLRGLYGEEHRLVGRPLLDLARIALARGDLDVAEERARAVVSLWRRVLPPGHRWTGEAEREMGAVLLARGRLAQAEPLLLSGNLDAAGRPALQGSRRLRVLRRLVDLHRARGDAEAARRVEREMAAVERDLHAQGGRRNAAAGLP